MKSTFRNIVAFWVYPCLYKPRDPLHHFVFNSALDWLSFNDRNKYDEFQHPVPLLSSIIKFSLSLTSVYVLPCSKDALYLPYQFLNTYSNYLHTAVQYIVKYSTSVTKSNMQTLGK